MFGIVNLTTAKFVEKNSILHKTNPITKFLIAVGMSFYIFLKSSFSIANYTTLFSFLTFLIILSRIPITSYLKDLKNVWLIIVLVFLGDFSLIRQPGIGTILSSFENALKICAVFLLFYVFARTTNPFVFVRTLQILLQKVRLQNTFLNDLLFVVQLAFRFIPLVFEETVKMMMLYKLRGWNLNTKNPFKKFFAIPVLVVPILVSALRKAERIATAMEARRFGFSNHVTSFYEITFSFSDVFLTAMTCLTITLLTVV
ncbi:energy-coupling factor transporter transmembrane component T family protein [Pseudothermotoga thermarum]|uniref:Cobalt transport protein n=1 Tax=Pseudothermotoga thermarum DSM 5069 TaxID=688269 RepID=F7YYU9_9THEM|nr:energy-coupling factor transporter transmembrane component T [Pseudothermotoga thermarum]AEH51141.1 cobalt transport protein [Pseudothermotoga thermarum DSM 5069]